MTHRNQAILFGLISIFILSCRSTKKTVDKVKTKEVESISVDLTDETIESGTVLTENEFDSLEVTVEALEGSGGVSVESKGDKLIIKGGKTVKISKNKGKELSQISQISKKESETKVDTEKKTSMVSKEKDVKRKGVSLLWIIPAILVGLGILVWKKPSIFGINIEK